MNPQNLNSSRPSARSEIDSLLQKISRRKFEYAPEWILPMKDNIHTFQPLPKTHQELIALVTEKPQAVVVETSAHLMCTLAELLEALEDNGEGKEAESFDSLRKIYLQSILTELMGELDFDPEPAIAVERIIEKYQKDAIAHLGKLNYQSEIYEQKRRTSELSLEGKNGLIIIPCAYSYNAFISSKFDDFLFDEIVQKRSYSDQHQMLLAAVTPEEMPIKVLKNFELHFLETNEPDVSFELFSLIFAQQWADLDAGKNASFVRSWESFLKQAIEKSIRACNALNK